MPSPKDAEFLRNEYAELWRDWGIDLERLPSCVPSPSPKAPSQAPTLGAAAGGLESVRSALGDCRRCGLCADRKNIVFGVGDGKARLMFIGEGPGADEDAEGIPFVGKAGQLLNRILDAMGIKREEVYIANIVKCRPPENRTPQPDEIAACLPFLKAQIEMIQPSIVVALGNTAAQALTHSTMAMSNLRGRFHTLAWNPNVRVMATYHPAYLLRNEAAKRLVWEDMKLVKGELAK